MQKFNDFNNFFLSLNFINLTAVDRLSDQGHSVDDARQINSTVNGLTAHYFVVLAND